MTRLLVLLEAGAEYPSGFLRGLIYQEQFKQAGFDVRFMNRRPPWLVRLLDRPPVWLYLLLQAGGRNALLYVTAAVARLNERRIASVARDFDVVYMSKITSHRLLKRLRKHSRARLVLDFGDAMWLPRYRLPHFNDMLALVDHVTTDNAYTAAYVRRFNANCTIIPDVPQVERFDEVRDRGIRRRAGGRVRIGWIGSPGTAFNLYVVWEALEQLFARRDDIELRLLGVGHDPAILPPFEAVRYTALPTYTQAQMIEEVLAMDIGLFPLQDVAASRVRGILKASVYMAGEAAIVCSPVGQNVDAIQDGVTGLFARSTEEWVRQLECLIANPALRERLAAAGLATARAQYSLAASFRILENVLKPNPQ